MPVYRDAQGNEYYSLSWDLEERPPAPFDGPDAWSGRPIQRFLRDEPNHFRLAGLLTLIIVSLVALAGPWLLWQAGGQFSTYVFMAFLPLFFVLNSIVPTVAMPWRTEPAKVERALTLVRPQPLWAGAEMVARGAVIAVLGICVALSPTLVASLDGDPQAAVLSSGARMAIWGVGGVLVLGGLGLIALEINRLRESRT
ncbi:MAG TPA: hypothetical protein VED40_06065 [Azospirillaceae bacterium]|nr:hypothetical protein [Azospirillaceae bacterium]